MPTAVWMNWKCGGSESVGFSVVHNRIRLIRGDSAEIVLTIYQPEGEIFVPEDGDKIIFTLKKDEADENFLLQKKMGEGIIRDENTYHLIFNPEDTEHLPWGRYIYDVELERRNGYIDTIIPASSFFVERNVTDHGP